MNKVYYIYRKVGFDKWEEFKGPFEEEPDMNSPDINLARQNSYKIVTVYET